MGERKGQNKYYPPDFDYKVHKSLAGYHGEHPLRERAKKLDKGILIIRFEMPYNIWCGGCNAHIGMGVRYNAEKSKVGMYYTTPLYQFRMKCHLCSNHFVIRTDPSKHDYVITEGARRKEQRWDPHENEQIVPEDRETQKKLVLDSMYKLEHGGEDASKGRGKTTHLASLIEHRQLRGKHDHLANQIAREQLRASKKRLAESQAKDESLKKKLCLSIDLVEETEDDSHRARLMSYAAHSSFEDRQVEKREAILKRPLFSRKSTKNKSATTTPSSASGSTGLNVNKAAALRLALGKRREELETSPGSSRSLGLGFGVKVNKGKKKQKIGSSDSGNDKDLTMNIDEVEIASQPMGDASEIQPPIESVCADTDLNIHEMKTDSEPVVNADCETDERADLAVTNGVADTNEMLNISTNENSETEDAHALSSIFCNYASSSSNISDSE